MELKICRNILCGPIFENSLFDHLERRFNQKETKETFKMFYKISEKILTLKESEKRAL